MINSTVSSSKQLLRLFEIIKAMILISIIIPAFNVAPYISECLDSLISQTFHDIEIIVIDDGSTDETGIIADRYQKIDKRISVIHQSNQGISAARNAGLMCARGKYIAFVDADDWVSINAYQLLYEKAEQLQTDLILGSVVHCYTDGQRRRRGYTGNLCKKKSVITGKACFSGLLWNDDTEYMPVVYTSLYRSELIKRNRLQFHGRVHEDELWFPQIMYYAKRVTVLEEDFYYYRQRDGSLTHTDNLLMRSKSIIEVANRLIDFWDKKITKKGNLGFSFDILYRVIYLLKCSLNIYPAGRERNFHLFNEEKCRYMLSCLPNEYKEALQNYYRNVITIK